MGNVSRDHAPPTCARTCLRTLALALLLTGCARASHPEAFLVKQCNGIGQLWADGQGHRWVGINLKDSGTDFLDPVAPWTPDAAVCP